jgi:polysaccharide export outer membrane protein
MSLLIDRLRSAAWRALGARVALGVALVLGAPGATASAQAPSEPSASPDSASAAAAQRAANVPIAVGDRVRVKVWREPAFSDSVTVDQRGEVVLPRVGPMRVAGRTISTLQDTLRSRYAEWLRDPTVTVTVYRRVGVQGEVRAPSLYYVDVTMTLREVLAQAGGITEAGNTDDVSIVRDGRTMKLGKWRAGGPLSAELRSGDQVVVGRRSWLSRNALAAVSTLGLVVSVAVQVYNSSR